MDSHGLWRNRFVCHGQLWLVKQNGFFYLGQLWSEENRISSVVESYRCLPLTAMFGRAKDLGWH